MKKITFLVMALFLLFGAYAQQTKKEIQYTPRLNEILGVAKVNDLKANNPQQLLIEHINVTYYCFVAQKLTGPEGTYIMKDELKNHLKASKSCNYQEIIQNEFVNRYDFELEQDATRPTIYPIGNTGFYVIVNSKEWFNAQKQALLAEYGF
jgi:hypothetical protein